MNVPKIKFKEMSLEENIDIIKDFYFDDNGSFNARDFIIRLFPKAKDINPNLSKNEIYKKIEDIVSIEYNKNISLIKKETIRYASIWSKYNNEYLEKLSSYLEIKWPNNVNEIVATVGLIPICPRFLDTYSFSVGIELTEERILEICAHETLHFLWFEKWAKLYPDTPRKEFDSPYLVWKYSEMVTDPILNNKPFSTIFKFTERGYDSFYLLEYNGQKVMDVLRDIYNKDISIDKKIDTGFEYIKTVYDNN